MRQFILIWIFGLVAVAAGGAAPPTLLPPVERDGWILPAAGDAAEPVWGIAGGIRVGLWPLPGPRGLIRVYAPFLGQPERQPVNFVAMEPVVNGVRGLSELERSEWDHEQGKRIWTGQSEGAEPGLPWKPEAPRFTSVDGHDVMRFTLRVEPFQNGARPVIEVSLRKDRPREITFATRASGDSAPMDACVLTTTMGNYGRLRRIWLREAVESPGQTWPDLKGKPFEGFAPPHTWNMEHLLPREGEVIVAATSDEAEPAKAAYAADTPAWWHYQGRAATQFWRATAREGLAARANARYVYWGTQSPIPGGMAYENFELSAPYLAGEACTFGVTDAPPEELGFAPRSGTFTLWQLPNQTRQQMMSYVLKTRGGKLVVIDGGTAGDAPYLRDFLKNLGGRVERWFITHPHDDHCNALCEILKNPDGIEIGEIHASLPDAAWVSEVADPSEKKTHAELLAVLAQANRQLNEVSLGQEIRLDGMAIQVIGIKNPELRKNPINNSCMVLRVSDEQKSVLFLADLGYEAGEKLLGSHYADRLCADYVQMAHHGQNGVSEAVYQLVRPAYCLWPTPKWLWENDPGTGPGTGRWKTLEVRAWMERFPIRRNYLEFEGLHRIE